MFRVQPAPLQTRYRLAMVVLLAMSVAALGVTVWVMVEFLREQELVRAWIRTLPPDATAPAETLVGELRWQFRLSILVVLNLIVTGVAVLLLWRAWSSSQESLRDFKALAGDILSSIDQAVLTTDPEGRLTSINRCGIELFGLSGEYVGRPIADLAVDLPLDEFLRATREAAAGVQTRDFRVLHKGTTRTLRAFCQSLRDAEGSDIGNVLQIRDVTERVLLDDRMRRMERYLGLGSLAAGLHHEIKNPLAALSLHVQLLEEELDASGDSDDVHRMLGVIKTEVTRVGGVLESFRDFASVGRLNLGPVDLYELISRQAELVRPQAELAGIDVRIAVPDKPLPPLTADRARLEQVLLNLLINAIEAMPQGGQLVVQLQVDNVETPATVRIDIADTGPGIPDTIRDRVFDAYFTTKSQGTGMGLALCDKITRQHSGSLDVESSAAGTTFSVTLPLDALPGNAESVPGISAPTL